MRKAAKIWLFTAAVLVVLGLTLLAGVVLIYDWDFTKLGTVTYVSNTYKVNDTFDEISINVDTTEIEFVPTEDETCSIVCFEAEKAKHSATVQNGMLVIETIDTRKWFDYIGISFGSPKMTVFLPQNEYASLCIEANTGDININSITAHQVNLATTTGKISVNSLTAKNSFNIQTDTGKMKLNNVSCSDLVAESDTGTITLKNVVATGSFSVESDTGDVEFEGCDAAQIFVKTSTGEVTGRLLSEKVFIAETSTGEINVPKTTSGGKCEIITSTGDIEINVTP